MKIVSIYVHFDWSGPLQWISIDGFKFLNISKCKKFWTMNFWLNSKLSKNPWVRMNPLNPLWRGPCVMSSWLVGPICHIDFWIACPIHLSPNVTDFYIDHSIHFETEIFLVIYNAVFLKTSINDSKIGFHTKYPILP